jgi:hypothetical protein
MDGKSSSMALPNLKIHKTEIKAIEKERNNLFIQSFRRKAGR